MIEVIGVRFRPAGKIYFFDPVDLEIEDMPYDFFYIDENIKVEELSELY